MLRHLVCIVEEPQPQCLWNISGSIVPCFNDKRKKILHLFFNIKINFNSFSTHSETLPHLKDTHSIWHTSFLLHCLPRNGWVQFTMQRARGRFCVKDRRIAIARSNKNVRLPTRPPPARCILNWSLSCYSCKKSVF